MSKLKSVGEIVEKVLDDIVVVRSPVLGDAPAFVPTEHFIESSGHLVELRNNDTKRVSLSFVGDDGRTNQSHTDSCDISKILESHLRLGSMPPIPESSFNDFTDLPDYQTALNTVMSIDTLFNDLPIKVKSHFNNDPAALMAAVEDPSQRDTLIGLGVFTPMDGASVPSPSGDGQSNSGSEGTGVI